MDSSHDAAASALAAPPPLPVTGTSSEATAPADSLAASSSTAVPILRVVINLSALLALGVLISGWILFYTEWFPVVSGLLGLGGLFAWVAFVAGLLTEDRKKELQAEFERTVLGSHATWKVAVVTALVCLLSTSLFGCVVLDTARDDHGRVLAGITPVGRSERSGDDSKYLVPHSEEKFPLYTGWPGRQYSIKVSGLPAAISLVRPLRRIRLTVPTSFGIRPVLLIRPSRRLSNDGAKGYFGLKVTRNGSVIGTLDRDRYHGESVWVGCDPDVTIPERVVAAWRLELARASKTTPAATPTLEELASEQEVLTRWTTPLAVGDSVVLSPGEAIEATLVAGDGHTVVSRRETVRSASGGPTNVQELSLKLPAPTPDPNVGKDLNPDEEAPKG